MSMIYFLLGVSSQQLVALSSNPALADSLVKAAIDNHYEIAKTPPPELAYLGPIEKQLSIETGWHILHYLLTGHASAYAAPGDLLLAGTEIGSDQGYGPPRRHSVAATIDFAHYLEPLTVSQLQDRVNYKRMVAADLYGLPGGGRTTDAENTAELRQVVNMSLPPLKNYIGRMASKQFGLLTWLT